MVNRGDRVYCIRDNYDGSFDYHYKGNWYVVNEVYNTIVYVNSNLNSPGHAYGYNIKHTFNHYFITENEYRRRKLRKLNSIQ